MKQFISKRLLPVFLAAVLVVISVPTTVFLIFSADADGSDTVSGEGTNSSASTTNDFTAVDNSAFIENANALSNGINAYFGDADRDEFFLENDHMKLQYNLNADGDNPQIVGALQNSQGNSYFENSMDIFIDMKNNDGGTTRFYSSESSSFFDTGVCMDHFGHYYYEATFEDQDFLANFVEVEAAEKVTIAPHDLGTGGTSQASVTNNPDGTITFTVNDPGTSTPDPYVYTALFESGDGTNNYQYSADDYDYIKITMKSEGGTSTSNGSLELFYAVGEYTYARGGYSKSFTYSRDGEYHTYYIPMSNAANYTGNVNRFRLDFASNVGEQITVSEFSAVNATCEVPDALTIKRYFGMYNDNKLSHKLQIATNKIETTDIFAIGIETKVPASDVSGIIAYNQTTGTTTTSITAGQTLEGLRYLALDTSAGVLGYILVEDGNDDSLALTFDGTDYIITQSRIPTSTLYTYTTDENGKEVVDTATVVEGAIYPSAKWILGTDGQGSWITHVTGAKNNSNDFFMLNRLYVDENHTFEEFLKVAAIEMNPLGEENFEIYSEDSTLDLSSTSTLYPNADGNDGFRTYDPFTGAYVLQLDGGGFTYSQYNYPNRHWNIKFKVTGDELDRGDIYVWTYADNGGQLECAAILDENYMMLPIPLQVAKNFSEYRGERDIFNISDATYSYTMFPVDMEANGEASLNVIHIQQNWGNYPNKQISSIQFHCPYYHLSTGTTESNCIVPWYTTERSRGLTTLPDHRGASSPFWTGQPQHNSTGSHRWLYYTDAEGNKIASETVDVYVGAYGPVYADLTMKYISDDGAISVEYNHMEMPQTDENRGYYEMKYTVNSDISFESFKEQFTFFSMTDNDSKGIFQRISYVDENNEFAYVTNKYAENTEDENAYIYTLGDVSPYFTFFDMEGYASGVNQNADNTTSGYANLSFIVKDYELNLTDTAVTNFALINQGNRVGLTLDADALTLKAGDTITINAIVMPWGSQEMDTHQEFYANDGDPTTVDYDYDDTVYVNADRKVLLTSDGFIYEPSVLYALNGNVSTESSSGAVAYNYDNLYLNASGELLLNADGTAFEPEIKDTLYVDADGNISVTAIEGATEYSFASDVYISNKGLVLLDTEGNPYKSSSTGKLYLDSEGNISDTPSTGSTQYVYTRTAYITADGNALRIDGTVYVPVVEEVLYVDSNGNVYYTEISDATEYRYQYTMYVNADNKVLLNGDGSVYEPSVLYLDADGNISITASEGAVAYYNETYLDKNIRDVRYNSCLNPFTVTSADAITTSVTEEPFLGVANSLNGESATFTLTGGYNNMAVVVNGFDKLTVPVVEELVDGEWVHYELSSLYTPDKYGYGYAYDGYSVTYDAESSTYSYAFIVDMTDVASRTFRVTATEDFAGWTDGVEYDRGIEVFYKAELLEDKITNRTKISSVTYYDKTETDEAFVRVCSSGYTSTDSNKESYFIVKNGGELTGKYLLMRYRIPEEYGVTSFEFYADTDNGSAQSADVFYSRVTGDGEWHTLVIDLNASNPDTFLPDENGDYYAPYVRFDIFNGDERAAGDYVDFAYIGFTSELDTAFEFLGADHLALSERSSSTAATPSINVVDKNFLYSAESFYNGITSSSVDKTLTSTETGMPYVNLKLAEGVSAPAELYKTLYSSSTAYMRSGQYLAILYRSASSNTFQFYMQSNSAETNYLSKSCTAGTGEWEYMIVDMSQGSDPTKYVDENGMKLFRFDYSNSSAQVTNLDLDIAFLSMFDSVEAANEFFARYVEKYGVDHDCYSDGAWQHVTGEPKECKLCGICGEVLAERATAFIGCVELSDGTSVATAESTNSVSSVDASALLMQYDEERGYYLTFTGEWVAVNGGVRNYVYKINDGEWIAFDDQPTSTDPWGTDYANVINNQGLEIDVDNSYLNGYIDGCAMYVDLNGYNGQDALTVTFGATLEGNPDVVLEIAGFTGIETPEVYTEGLEFTENADGTYTVSGYTGSDTNVVIPSTYLYASVVAIADAAFEDCAITGISIPASVTDIGMGVFAGCAALTEITVSADNTAYSVVDNCIVTADGTTVVATCASSEIPSSVTAIGDGAFKGSTLTSLYIHKGITYIGAEAFADSSIMTLTYEGRPSEFDAMEKAENWAYGATYTLVCVDFDPEMGDVNVDGKIDADDVALMRQYIASKDPMTGIASLELGEGALYADLNGDGAINSYDLLALRALVEQ